MCWTERKRENSKLIHINLVKKHTDKINITFLSYNIFSLLMYIDSLSRNKVY